MEVGLHPRTHAALVRGGSQLSSGFYGDGEGYANAMTGCGFHAITELGISASGQWSYTGLRPSVGLWNGGRR